jgi:hypothetical protein
MQPLYLIDVNELQSRIKQRTRVQTTNSLWTDAEVMNALNDAVEMWGDRVMIPFVYTISGGFVCGTSEYSLPDYVNEPIDPQFKFSGDNQPWRDLMMFEVYPSTDGTTTLRLPGSLPTASGQVIYWTRPSAFPSEAPVLDAQINSSATSLTLTTTPYVGRTGHLKIENEWISYADYSEASGKLTLLNLARGLNGTTAATHNAATSVYWGLGLHRLDLAQQLRFQTLANLHSLHTTNASPREREFHSGMMQYWQDQAYRYWKGYRSPRPPKMRLGSQATAGMKDTNNYRYWGYPWASLSN